METQDELNFDRIARAISFIRTNFKEQPSLDVIAGEVNVSPYHFQRLFTEWAGVSPKKFMQYTSIEYAKSLLLREEATLFDTAHETGLSGTGRLHDLFVNIEGMTPAEYRNGGEKLTINYSFAETPFGYLLVAATQKGICHMSFIATEAEASAALRARFPNARYHQRVDALQQEALFIFQHDWGRLHQIKLHLHGTPFQLKVWETLLKIPAGKLATYGSIAGQLEKPGASRAVGSAIGSNPIAYLIPCHRVIRASGNLGGYRWGINRKAAMIGWEAAKNDVSD
jgi:AraC family transcriptional regulator of adaptative response/methylated-DNA-[protein]-cysteine methyltransferase